MPLSPIKPVKALSVCLISLLALGCQTGASNGVVQLDAPLRSWQNPAPHAWLEINAQAFEDNLKTLKKTVGSKTQICAVMKADAYGHGVSLLIPSVIKLEIPYIGITSNQEAAAARAGGFKGKIMRLRTASLDEVREGLAYEIEELVGNSEWAEKVSGMLASQSSSLRYHLALNSGGMSRNGLEIKHPDALAEVEKILRLPHLRLVGLMTHYPVEEAADVKAGVARFKRDVDLLIQRGWVKRDQVLLHTANTFATLDVPEARLDLVRPGGALYGDVWPTHPEFKKVMQFKSQVVVVNSYPKGNTVNYDRTFTLKRASKLANIPVGYSDGYRRAFSNKGYVLIRGKRLPVLGRITMNTIMVDVTDAPEVQAGDEVVLFGRQGDEVITQQEIEKYSDTIYAELYTSWGRVNPRILVRQP